MLITLSGPPLVLKFLESSNGVIRFCKDPIAYVVHVDATLSHIGGAWGSQVYSAEILFDALAITQCEMFNIVVTARLWGHDWRDKIVNIKCDNKSAVLVRCIGKTRNEFLNLCLYNLI